MLGIFGEPGRPNYIAKLIYKPLGNYNLTFTPKYLTLPQMIKVSAEIFYTVLTKVEGLLGKNAKASNAVCCKPCQC